MRIRPPQACGGPGLRPGVLPADRQVERGVCVVRSSSCSHQPWRCLWRAVELQMTMTRPLRRMTLHLSQIGLTLGLTFTDFLRWVSYLYR